MQPRQTRLSAYNTTPSASPQKMQAGAYFCRMMRPSSVKISRWSFSLMSNLRRISMGRSFSWNIWICLDLYHCLSLLYQNCTAVYFHSLPMFLYLAQSNCPTGLCLSYSSPCMKTLWCVCIYWIKPKSFSCPPLTTCKHFFFHPFFLPISLPNIFLPSIHLLNDATVFHGINTHIWN